MLQGRTPTADEKAHMDRVACLPCIVCVLHYGKRTPAEVHHLDGKTKPGAHFLVIPLCKPHHRGGVRNDRIVSLHPHKAEFEKRYGNVDLLLAKTINWLEQGKYGC